MDYSVASSVGERYSMVNLATYQAIAHFLA